MDDEYEKLTARRIELFEPIHRQILMTDDKTDVVLLAVNMLSTSLRIFMDEYGPTETRSMVHSIVEQAIEIHMHDNQRPS